MQEHPYRWVIVAVGALMTCIAIGAMFSLAVFLDPMTNDTGWSRAGISTAMTLNFIVMGLGGFAWGNISDRYGTRIVVLIGAVLLGLALVLASRAGSLLEFQLIFGVLVGLSASTFFAPMIAATMEWFERQRSLAVSLVSVGIGVAPMTISPLASWLTTEYDWRVAMFVIGIGSWVLLIPAAFLVRKPPAPTAAGVASDAPPAQGWTPVWEALRSPQFLVLGFTFFICCAAHSGPIFHMVSYAIVCGIAPIAAVSIYSVEGLAGLGGRLLLGVLGDKYGAKPVLIGGLLVQALVIGAYSAINQLEQFYVLAVIFGTAYGGVMPLYSVLARDYFGQHIMGAVLGALGLLSSFGMAFGPLIGGWVYDTFDGYSWMFIGSAIVGLGAMALAFTFPPQPSREQMQPA
ncbi:MAG TPA: MFS transporter [Rhizobiaceae bacterium]|nr:MFS transporter [Rhizobiaceae bacterium]